MTFKGHNGTTIVELFGQLSLQCLKCYAVLLLLFTLLSCRDDKDTYIPIETIAIHPSGMEYIGMESCAQCHKDIVESHRNTAHWLTSAIASETTIKGSFIEGNNSFDLNNETSFRMVKNDSGFFQELYLKANNQSLYAAPMQMVMGSGTKGQSYLVWERDALYQLQASYFTPTNSWVNSPGYPPNPVQARPVPGRCLECHTTFAKTTNAYYDNRFDKKTIVTGIDCQRCHGPVKKHVAYHRGHPNETEAKFVFSYQNLDREQRLDACALCHSGLREQQIRSNFAFMPGDRLDKFSLPDYDETNLLELDVHGNQYGLLQGSACFKQSKTMDCTTCHDPHKNERGNSGLFNAAWVNCHKNDNIHKETQDKYLTGFTDCISCHMPLSDSNVMKIQVSMDSLVSVKVRTHLIGIYRNGAHGVKK